MKDDFYTMGGGHFWEDVFFYQKWRIQRNFTTKQYRLLDNWDICRETGSFETCRETFVKYIDAHEIARQKGHMIIMIHGLGQSKNFFKPLWREALKHNFMAAAVNYPSSQKDLTAHIKQFQFFLEHLEDVTEVSFVTYGCGNLILQKLMNDDEKWQKSFSIVRAVEVCPCIFGSKLIEKLSKNSILSFIIGPMAKDLAPDRVSHIPALQKIESGIVLSNKPWYRRLVELLLGVYSPDSSVDEVQKITQNKNVIKIANRKLNIFNNPAIRHAVMSFLEKGKF